ncbi:hypothetical protein AADZ91_14770 [Colwelliaceae bacterium 6441]
MPTTISTSSLIKLTIAAFVFAIVMLLIAILPAEYNIDPTGIGKRIGLTQLAPENITPLPIPHPELVKKANDTVTITVPARRGIEFKFSMKKYAKLTYEWQSGDNALYHDLHGEPEGDTTGYYESYTIATANEMKGSFTAPFGGSHGWYWKNTTNAPIEVTLITSGEYQVIGLK